LSGEELYSQKSKVKVEEGIVTKSFPTRRDYLNIVDPILSAHSCKKSGSFYARKEAILLKELTNDSDFQMPPKFINAEQIEDESNQKYRRIQMEEIKGVNLMEAYSTFLRNGVNCSKITQRIPYIVSDLHHEINRNRDKTIDAVKWKYSRKQTHGLKLRSWNEERNRLWNYMRTIIYTLSPDSEMSQLREVSRNRLKKAISLRRDEAAKKLKYNKNGDNSELVINQELTRLIKDDLILIRRDANSGIKKYLDHNGITNRDFDSFVNRDYEILFCAKRKGNKVLVDREKMQIIHGDLGPQHIYLETDGDELSLGKLVDMIDSKDSKFRVIDYDEARLDVGEVDLSAAMYNIFTSPSTPEEEIKMISFAIDYFDQVSEKKLNEEESASRTIITAECRLKNFQRLLAADCKASIDELRRYVGGHTGYEDLPDEELRSKFIKEELLEKLEHLLNFYQRGSGRDPRLPHSNLFYQQLNFVEKTLTLTNIFKGAEDNSIVGDLESILKERF
jgi:hypothetical protein